MRELWEEFKRDLPAGLIVLGVILFVGLFCAQGLNG